MSKLGLTTWDGNPLGAGNWGPLLYRFFTGALYLGVVATSSFYLSMWTHDKLGWSIYWVCSVGTIYAAVLVVSWVAWLKLLHCRRVIT